MRIMAAEDNHYIYKKDLGYELILPLVRARSLLSNLTVCIRKCMELIGVDVRPQIQQTSSVRQGRCGFCDRKRDKKTTTRCDTCNVFICASHVEKFCPSCSILMK